MKIIRLLLVAFTATFFVSSALAQNVGTVTNHAYAIGKGASKQGFTSLLCASAQLAVGQSAADPICRTVTGDVTISAAGVTAIGSAKVTIAMMAAGTQDTVLGYFGSTAASALAINNCANALTYSTSTHTFGCNVSAGTGTVTSIGLTNTYGLSVSGSPVTSSGNISAGVSLTIATNSIGADVALNNTSNYFDGPSAAQGTSGTWFASGTVTITDPTNANTVQCKLWDGTTVIASTEQRDAIVLNGQAISLSGFLASPAANIRISCKSNTTTAVIAFNKSGNSKDSTITAVRIAP